MAATGEQFRVADRSNFERVTSKMRHGLDDHVDMDCSDFEFRLNAVDVLKSKPITGLSIHHSEPK